MLLQLLFGFFVAFGILYLRLRKATSYTGGVPRVGKSGLWGYILTAIRWTIDAEGVILEGRSNFSGGPFVIPTLSGSVFFLPPSYLEEVRAGNDDVFNEPMAVNEDLQLPYTMDIHQLRNPYQAAVLRTDVNRSIPAYIPDILDESLLAMDKHIPIVDGKPVEIPVFDTMTHLIARISNRVIFGREMCRNEEFLHAVVRFAETTPLMAPFIHWSPVILRPVVYFILSSILGGKKEALKYVIPFLETYMKERDYLDEKPTLVCEFLIKNAPPEETIEGIAIRLLNLNFGSIHTSSIFISQVLFEIALLSKEDIDSIRAEVIDALETEGGWTKSALLKFRKIDSALREVGRVYGLMHFALPRFALKGCDLGNGQTVPRGQRVAIDMKAIHYNPHVYPDPERCDLFRFSKLREQEESDSRYGFATVDNHYLPFGAGRHACAGRFFAAMELKIMLAHILLTYDLSYTPGATGRPKNIIFNGAIVPDTKAKIIFTPHETWVTNRAFKGSEGTP